MEKKKILIVEDNPDDLYLLVRALKRLNEAIPDSEFDFVTAADGAEALAIVNSRPHDFDVLITDRKMPRMNSTIGSKNALMPLTISLNALGMDSVKKLTIP